ncbi:unnamed protein product [Urochloa humidicola]
MLVVPAAETSREGRQPASLLAPLHPVVLHREISPPPRSSRTDRRRRWPRRRRQRRPGGGDAGDEVADLALAPALLSLPPRTSTSSASLPLMLGTTSSGSGTGHGGGRPHISGGGSTPRRGGGGGFTGSSCGRGRATRAVCGWRRLRLGRPPRPLHLHLRASLRPPPPRGGWHSRAAVAVGRGRICGRER